MSDAFLRAVQENTRRYYRTGEMACMFMSDRHAVENMKRYPDQIQPFIQAEIRLAHTWKKGRSLEQLWDQCQDIDDVEQERLAS